jgi:osmotically-inducible protein OsmY
MDAVTARTDPRSSHYTTAEAAERRLRRSPYIELRLISCEVCDGVLTLRGRVPTYYLKQVAQYMVDGLPGVQKIDNDLEVVASCHIQGAGREAPDSSPPARPRPR